MLDFIMGIIGTLLYPLFSIFFLVIDMLQAAFMSLAGVGDVNFRSYHIGGGGNTAITAPGGGDGGDTSTGLIYFLLRSDLVKNLFLSIILLALFLIIIFTAMAFIKNAYSAKQKNWQEIVGNAFKGLANFIFIPVCCLLGVWLSNILLVAINGATSTGGAVKMSRKLFTCCAYNANQYRNKDELSEDDVVKIGQLVDEHPIITINSDGTEQISKITFDASHSKNDVEYFAGIVDQVYAQSDVGIYWQWQVSPHYQLFNINYLVLLVGAVFMLYVLANVAYAMVKRMFLLIIYFVVSPAICAMYPIDEGSAVNNWKKEFIKQVLSAYGAVAGMNLFFSILPIVDKIDVFVGMGVAGFFFNDIFQLFIMVCGLFTVKEFIGTLSGWIGGDNAMTAGDGMKSSVTKGIKNVAAASVLKTSSAFRSMGKASAAKKDFKESLNLKDGEKMSAKQWLQMQGKGLGSIGKDAKDSALKGIDKSVFGGKVQESLLGDGDEKKWAGAQGAKDYKDAKDKKEMKGYEKILKDETKKQKETLIGNNFGIDDGKGLGKGVKYQDLKGKNSKDKRIAKAYDDAKELGMEDQEIYSRLSKVTGEDITKLKERVKAGHKAGVEEDKEKDRKAEAKLSEKNFEKLGDILANKITGARPGGTETAGEATARERANNQYTKLMAEYLKQLVDIGKQGGDRANADLNKAKDNLMNFNPGGADSPFAKLIEDAASRGQTLSTKQIVGNVQIDGDFDKLASALDAYNHALDRTKIADYMAAEATSKFVEEMKKSVEIEKAFSKLGKTIELTEEKIREMAKEIQELTKNK